MVYLRTLILLNLPYLNFIMLISNVRTDAMRAFHHESASL
jgi:hypothetical protein